MLKKILLIIILISGLMPVNFTNAQTISERLRGRLLLQVEQGGAIWYVDTNDLHRYSVTWANALPLFEKLSLGITDNDLSQVPITGSKQTDNLSIRNRLKGKLLLQVEQRGAIWYVDKDGYRHSVTWTNLMPLFENLALGITNKDLEEIPIGSLKVESEKTSTNNGNICEEGNIFYNNKCITYDEHCHIYYGEYSYSTKHDNFGNNTCDCKVGYKWFYEIETPTNYCVENKVVRNDLKGSEKGLVKNYTFTYDWAGINISRYWNDKNQSEEINISIEVPQELYDQYVYQKTHIFANDFSNLSDFVTYNDEVIKNVANQIDQLYQNTGMNPVLIAQLLVDEIVYTDDINAGYNEYPKYPVETLVDGKGDCEDTSFLLSALLRASKLSFQSALIEFENHIGIAIIVLNDTYNDYIDDGMVDYIKANTYLDDAKMLYVETTGQKWKVGTMPTSLIDQKQTIHLIE